MYRRMILLAAVGAGLAGCAAMPGAARAGSGVGGSDFLRGDPYSYAPAGEGMPAAVQQAPRVSMPAAAQQAPRVSIDNFSFSPAELTVKAGSKVVWVNHDDVPHTVVGDAREFSSKALDTDDEFSHVFADAGTYAYFCGVHPHMTGRIVVVK
jgi:plastocyanin